MKKFKIRNVLAVGLLTVSVGLLGACGNSGGADDEAAAGGGDIVWVASADAPSLDPQASNDSATADATNQIFERLVNYGENGEVVPWLAESFEATSETTWEFKLREDITFSDGTAFNAEAVKANFDRLLDPEMASPMIVLFDMVTEVNVIDEYIVEFVTEYAFAPLPSHIAHTGAAIIAPSAIEEETNGGLTVSENPIGTGAFVLDSWNTGSEIVFVPNENYWGAVPQIDSLTFQVVPEASTRMAMLEAGEAHAANVDPVDAATIEAMENIELERISSTRLEYLGFNLDREPFNDVRVRQAISMAINKVDILDGILQGEGTAATGMLAPTVAGNTQDVDILEYDVEAARELLAEAGFADGFSTTIYVNDGSAARATIAELIQSQLAAIGIDVTIQIVEWGAFLEMTAAGEHEMFLLGWTTVTGDADYGLFAMFHSSNLGDPGNRAFFVNERADELLEAGRTTADQDDRDVIYAELTQLLIDEAPLVPLYYPNVINGTNGISGFDQDFNGTVFFGNVVLD